MKGAIRKKRKTDVRETLTEAYEVRAFRDESEQIYQATPIPPEILHAEAGAIQSIKEKIKGHGEQTVLPDDCQFGDNDLCSVES
jgi:hypothetical protein